MGRDAVVYIQISIAIEFLIFSCRTPGFVVSSVFSAGRPSLMLTLAVLASNILVTVLAGFGVLIYTVDWLDLAYIWLYDIAWLVVIDALKCIFKLAGQPWMSAGAAGGVLGYPELPERHSEPAGNASQLGSRVASATMNSRTGGMRSILNTSSRISHSALGSVGSNLNGSHVSVRSGSTLPFPHSLRAVAMRHNS